MDLRQSNLDKLQNTTYDVLVIGGGINGAVATAALAARGLKVGLIDRNDFASATSQESSNLVWGGIKYLEGFEFSLVRKLCLSRNQLIEAYPSTVKEIRFLASLEPTFRRSRFTVFLGSVLYWIMGNFFTQKPRLLSSKDIQKEEPIIDKKYCGGGLEYSDAYLHDNDARFVFNFVRSALDHGAHAANYVNANGSTRQEGLWHTKAEDRVSGHSFTITSKVLINACGPFADRYNQQSQLPTKHRHLFSKGIHLVINRVTPNKRVIAFFADDGRLFFVIPMGPKSCIGTTDTRVEKIPATVTAEDRRFVIDNINRRLRLSPPITEGDIIAERCGVRPLVVGSGVRDKDTGDWTSLSRKHILEIEEEERRISIFGGKLTDCINIGDGLTEAVEDLGISIPLPDRPWFGEPAQSIKDRFYHQAELMELDAMTAPESSEPLSERLWRRYGEYALILLEEIRKEPNMADVLIHGTEYIRCEIHHAARYEMVTRLEDFLRRRSKIALIAAKDTIREAPGLMEACKILFGDQGEERFNEYFAPEKKVAPSPE